MTPSPHPTTPHSFRNAPSEDSDQTAQLRRLIWIFAGRLCRKVRCLTLGLNVLHLEERRLGSYRIEPKYTYRPEWTVFCGVWYRSTIVCSDLYVRLIKCIYGRYSKISIIQTPIIQYSQLFNFEVPTVIYVCILTLNYSKSQLFKQNCLVPWTLNYRGSTVLIDCMVGFSWWVQSTLFIPTFDTTIKFVIKTIWMSQNHRLRKRWQLMRTYEIILH